MKVANHPIPCSRCGKVDTGAILSAAVILKNNRPISPGRALIYLRECMKSQYGDILVPLKRLLDVT